MEGLDQEPGASPGRTPAGLTVVGSRGEILSMSATWAKALGYSAAEVNGRSLHSILENDEGLDLASIRARQPMEVYRRDLSYLRKDGKTLFASNLILSVPGDPASVLILSEGKGQESPSENDLQRSEWRFRSFVENSSDIVVVIHADRTVGYQNPAVQKLLGYGPAETQGRPLNDFIHPDDRRRSESEWLKMLSHYDSDSADEVRVRHKDGTWRTLEVVAHNLLHNPVVSGMVMYCRDVTERAETRRKLREFAAEVDDRQAATLAHVKRALAGEGKDSLPHLLGDELLAPVTGMGELAVVLLTTKLSPAQRECAEKIRDSARNLVSAIRQMVENGDTPGADSDQRV